jgi:beta-phosphoglucomutase-like phosphatase (HAD superfamily)
MTVEWYADLDPAGLTHLLCDADGTLFPSEEPAYAASAGVTNRFLAELGASRAYDASELQEMSHGKNFRGAAQDLAELFERTLEAEALDAWVAEELEVVTAHLLTVLRPDGSVAGPVHQLAEHYTLAAVTSSAGTRLDACLEITGLAALFPPDLRFSAETSLSPPVSKPDPAVYLHAAECLGIAPEKGLAIEDSVNGARAAVAAGHPTMGLVQFVPDGERASRRRALREAGVVGCATGWTELAARLAPV